MAPDADKLRQRKVADSTQSASDENIVSLKHLQTNEVCIDGVIYDIHSFPHPGGDQIFVFGGNDVTVQYKMIHPHHTEKHLEKMKKVGKVTDFTQEYKFDTEFEREIKSEVFKIVRRGREYGTFGWYFRAFGYIAAFFYLQYLWVTAQTVSWQLAVVYGVAHAMIGMNVQHDANHGAASKKAWVNDLFGLGADFIGGSKWLWQEQHWTHHSFTNHPEKDPDGKGAEPFFLFNDYPLDHPARTWFHRMQVYFYLPILAGYWISSIFNPQIVDLRQRGALDAGIQMESPHIKKSRKYALGLRVLYIVTNIVMPLLHQGVRLPVFANIMLLGAAESLALAVLFSLSHNFENADRNPTKAAQDSGEPVCWFKAQVETSCTYGGFISGCLTGGLNFQVEHHLFPRMSSSWYPYIAPTVRRVCAKHGVNYRYYPWVWQNLVSTLKYINAAGTGSNWVTNPLSGDN